MLSRSPLRRTGNCPRVFTFVSECEPYHSHAHARRLLYVAFFSHVLTSTVYRDILLFKYKSKLTKFGDVIAGFIVSMNRCVRFPDRRSTVRRHARSRNGATEESAFQAATSKERMCAVRSALISVPSDKVRIAEIYLNASPRTPFASQGSITKASDGGAETPFRIAFPPPSVIREIAGDRAGHRRPPVTRNRTEDVSVNR
ncbi:hypothetical protein EVAR_71802_1 [Eumeta japonica]|uniref:Uncharacterized protein n=1 Tax=Eumeta variegata TaxID=151549 RepID=A0A4C1SS89_EUMVA|nr:hypothetical protein EVAR_71802_1 [Eumeta japonica]